MAHQRPYGTTKRTSQKREPAEKNLDLRLRPEKDTHRWRVHTDFSRARSKPAGLNSIGGIKSSKAALWHRTLFHIPAVSRTPSTWPLTLRHYEAIVGNNNYLGHRNTVGENLRYLIRDRRDRPVACALFGSAAWKCADRDAFLGWERATRERNLHRLTNNTRFLVLPWVVVAHLASHVLGLIAHRIRADWQAKYGHPVQALETFVDRDRFKGTCYQAANWRRLGATRGRTRNDREHCIRATVKDVYLYPLSPDFRQELGA